MNLHDIPRRRPNAALRPEIGRRYVVEPIMEGPFFSPDTSLASLYTNFRQITRGRQILEDIHRFRSRALSGGMRESDLDRVGFLVHPSDMYELHREIMALNLGYEPLDQRGRLRIEGIRVIVERE